MVLPSSSVFNLDANVSHLTINVDKCEKICSSGPLTAASASMHTNYVLEEVSVPWSLSLLSLFSVSISLSLPLFLSLSTLPAFGFTEAVASPLTLHSHFFQGITKRERLKITLIDDAWLGQKARGVIFIHLFYSLLGVHLKDLPTLSSQSCSCRLCMPLAVTGHLYSMWLNILKRWAVSECERIPFKPRDWICIIDSVWKWVEITLLTIPLRTTRAGSKKLKRKIDVQSWNSHIEIVKCVLLG